MKSLSDSLFTSTTRLYQSLPNHYPLFIILLTICILWEIYVWVFQVPSYILPTPVTVLQALLQYHRLVLSGLIITMIEMIVGLLGGVFLGSSLALPIAFVPQIRRFILPLLIALESIPKIAIAPLIVFWLGIGLAAKAFLVVLIVCFPTAITLARGLRSVDEETLLFAQMLCAPNWRIIWKIHLPAAIPSLFDSFRLSIPLAMVGAVIGEFISSDGGLGNILLVAISTLNMPLAFASLLAMSIATMLCYLPLLPFERYLLRWQPLWQR